MKRKYEDYDWSDTDTCEWEENGATYTLSFEMYAYADSYEKVAGSGVRNLYLTVVKQGKGTGEPLHAWEELEVDKMKQKRITEYYEIAEAEMESRRED